MERNWIFELLRVGMEFISSFHISFHFRFQRFGTHNITTAEIGRQILCGQWEGMDLFTI